MKSRRIVGFAVFGLVCSFLSFQIHFVAASTTTFPSLSIDGLLKSHLYANYSAAHDEVTGGAVDAEDVIIIGQFYDNNEYQIIRGAIFFDTSPIPDGANIISAKISLYCYLKGIGSGSDFNVVLVSGADLSDSGLLAADYGDLLDETISRGSLNTASITEGAYCDIYLNETGINEISKTGITKFALRSDNDIDSDPPIEDDYIYFYSYEAGTDYCPKLEVAYIYPPDNTPPVSSVNTISPYWQTLPITITATATDDNSGVSRVALWYRYSFDNGNIHPWTSWTWFWENDTSPPWSWQLTREQGWGEGYYEFYSTARDFAGNEESPPSEKDALCCITPTSSVDPIEPYWQIQVPFTVTASASDPLSLENVELWYRYSHDNSTWSDWELYDVDKNGYDGWSWSLELGTDGYYEFYSIGTLPLGNRERAPSEADATCVVIDVEKYLPVLRLSKKERWYPCSFYFDNDNDIDNNPSNWKKEGIWYQPYAYVHTVEDETRFAIQYWLYYTCDDYPGWGDFGLSDHEQDWEKIIVVFDKQNLIKPLRVGFSQHSGTKYYGYSDVEWYSTHPVSYVADGKHANYPTSDMPRYYIFYEEIWDAGGENIYPENFYWYLVKGCTDPDPSCGNHLGYYEIYLGEWKYIIEHGFCPMDVELGRGDNQPEPVENLGSDHWWPHYFGDPETPWHRSEWNETQPGWWWLYEIYFKNKSPTDLHVYDSENRHVGVNYETREVEMQIPDVRFYFDNEGHQCVKILDPDDENYAVRVVGIENGTYSLQVACLENGVVEYWNEWHDLPVMEGETQSVDLDQQACIVSPKIQQGLAGETLTYNITIINFDNVKDNFTLTAEDNLGWDLALSGNSFEGVQPGENRTSTLSVTVPADKLLGIINIISVKAAGTRMSAFAPCAVHVLSPCTGTVTFRLENLYAVTLEEDLWLYQGSKLVVKFYKYDNTYESGVAIENFIPPVQIEENEIVLHPSGIGVKRARLDLTGDNTENVISTIASFTMHQSDLRNRFFEILGLWFPHPELHDAFRAEIMDILSQWFSAPP